MSSRIPHSLRRLQDRLASLVGSGPEHRAPIIEQLLSRDAKEAVAYWLQLSVSVGIATLGLVLGSTAVVIAAMLVAPLMGPIIGLAMGLATGGPFLTLRAALRVLASVVMVILGAAAVTSTLPFHEMNAEIAARTVPTALDLITAAFCALAGVYATARTASDTATTAAGTSIGISLVPPLCAAGFCFATSQWALALGAALLFLTNLVAIVVVGTLSFVALGFDQVAIASLEASHIEKERGAPVVRRVSRVLAQIYAWRGGSWLRLLMPLVLLGAVYVPLRTALDEVTWQVEVRGVARRLLDRLDAEVVTSRLRVERHQIDMSIVIIGARDDAERLRGQLESELTRASGVEPRVEVRAVPDASAAAAVERLPPLEPVVTALPPDPFATRAAEVHDEIVEALSSRWPASSLGEPLAIDIDATASDLSLRVTHVGDPLDDATREVLERSLGVDLDVAVSLLDEALPSRPFDDLDAPDELARLAVAVERSRRFRNVHICVHEPAPQGPLVDPQPDEGSAIDPVAAPAAEVPSSSPTERAAVRGILDSHPRVNTVPAERWALWFALGGCPPTPAP
jgi:uncharacterized hydrophobic protein (TIGR00271 family)